MTQALWAIVGIVGDEGELIKLQENRGKWVR
jgi:hypothetical protein